MQISIIMLNAIFSPKNENKIKKTRLCVFCDSYLISFLTCVTVLYCLSTKQLNISNAKLNGNTIENIIKMPASLLLPNIIIKNLARQGANAPTRKTAIPPINIACLSVLSLISKCLRILIFSTNNNMYATLAININILDNVIPRFYEI